MELINSFVSSLDITIRMGAGILAYGVHKQQLYVLLHTTTSGKKVGHLVDCGGGDKEGESSLQTAIREFAEETAGVFFPPSSMTREDLSRKISAISDVHTIQSLPEITESISVSKTFFEAQKTIHSPLMATWFSLWRYFVYVLEVPFIDTALLNDAMKSLGTKQKIFYWVPVEEVINIQTKLPLIERLSLVQTGISSLLLQLSTEQKAKSSQNDP